MQRRGNRKVLNCFRRDLKTCPTGVGDGSISSSFVFYSVSSFWEIRDSIVGQNSGDLYIVAYINTSKFILWRVELGINIAWATALPDDNYHWDSLAVTKQEDYVRLFLSVII